jgi:hypothetical protein
MKFKSLFRRRTPHNGEVQTGAEVGGGGGGSGFLPSRSVDSLTKIDQDKPPILTADSLAASNEVFALIPSSSSATQTDTCNDFQRDIDLCNRICELEIELESSKKDLSELQIQLEETKSVRIGYDCIHIYFLDTS